MALFFGMLVIIGAYLLVNFTYLYVLPIDKIIDVHQGKNDIAAVAVVRHFAGNIGATIISIVILITTFGCTNSTILMPPRVYYAMAKANCFSPVLQRFILSTTPPILRFGYKASGPACWYCPVVSIS